jgi:acylphosphatase
VTEAAYRVRGRVQGVGFRWWVRAQATRLGLAGTVRNREDGSVEVHLRGPAGAVASLRALLAQGPPGAEVDTVEEHPFGSVPTEGFSILR